VPFVRETMCTGEALTPTHIVVDDDGDICHNPADLLGALGYVIDTAEGVRRRASRAAGMVQILPQALRADNPAGKQRESRMVSRLGRASAPKTARPLRRFAQRAFGVRVLAALLAGARPRELRESADLLRAGLQPISGTRLASVPGHTQNR
jgi:hypothetical protein